MTEKIPVRHLGHDQLAVGAIGYGAMSFGDYYGHLRRRGRKRRPIRAALCLAARPAQ
ncbi:hypothetical protein [Microbacterium rhizophilus]|uniref:hypothetical protein n=1 Tax=Microbacterium rhizophilus TaxID=3138934 RepID=UPI0031E8A72B